MCTYAITSVSSCSVHGGPGQGWFPVGRQRQNDDLNCERHLARLLRLGAARARAAGVFVGGGLASGDVGGGDVVGPDGAGGDDDGGADPAAAWGGTAGAGGAQQGDALPVPDAGGGLPAHAAPVRLGTAAAVPAAEPVPHAGLLPAAAAARLGINRLLPGETDSEKREIDDGWLRDIRLH